MEIDEYNESLGGNHPSTSAFLAELIERGLPEATAKVWHGHPVWFIDGNPIVGYHLQKSGLRILFWSGRSFTSGALTPVGNFQAGGWA